MTVFSVSNFVHEAEACVQVSDLALQRGYAAFDYLRTNNFTPLFLDDHIDRFFNSADRLHLQTRHTKEEVKEIVAELIRRNKVSESGVRMLLTGGYSPDSYTPVEPNLVITQQVLQMPSQQAVEKGVKVITHEYERDLPEVKSTNYLMGIYLQKKMKEQQASDVLYFKNNFISEFPRANVFIVTKEGKLVTPDDNILYGITRKNLLAIAAKNYQVEERPVSIEELRSAAEVFMTSTTKRILPVTHVDGAAIGNGHAGSVTLKLLAAFLELECQFL
jgi:D-alanine transaminase/branched-chain amino acid aminotransferase